MIYSGIVNIAIPGTFDGIYLDFTDTTLPGSNGATSLTEPMPWSGVNFVWGGSVIYNTSNFQFVRVAATQNAAVANIALYSTVGPSSTFGTGANASGTDDGNQHIGTDPGTFGDLVDGYLGFKFTPDGAAGPYYGWMQVKLTTDVSDAADSGGRIVQWAYSTSANTPVMVPEPAHYTAGTLVALVGFGVLRRCRARKAATA